MTPTSARPGGGDDRGLTLAELLVYCALLAIVLPLAGVLLHGALTSQRAVQGVTEATGSVQVVARSVERGIRSASAVSPLTAPTPGSQLLVARTDAGAQDRDAGLCQGWYYTGGVLYTRQVTVPGAPVPAITTTDLAQWTVLASGVGPRADGSAIFTQTTSGTTTTVGLDLAVTSGSKQLAVVSTAFTTRPQGPTPTGGTPCF